ncbi:MAG: hypothetical protein ACLRP3_10105 [Escherichia sp.]
MDVAIMENGQYDQDWKYIHAAGGNGAGLGGSERESRGAWHNGRFVLAKRLERSVDPAGKSQPG